uniref:Uncharacterized protein n=1 Tax=Anopheles farauti TaxID=69004 RepID=A0A182QQW4_9DIPT
MAFQILPESSPAPDHHHHRVTVSFEYYQMPTLHRNRVDTICGFISRSVSRLVPPATVTFTLILILLAILYTNMNHGPSLLNVSNGPIILQSDWHTNMKGLCGGLEQAFLMQTRETMGPVRTVVDTVLPPCPRQSSHNLKNMPTVLHVQYVAHRGEVVFREIIE